MLTCGPGCQRERGRGRLRGFSRAGAGLSAGLVAPGWPSLVCFSLFFLFLFPIFCFLFCLFDLFENNLFGFKFCKL
jgi:hypothetical protein